MPMSTRGYAQASFDLSGRVAIITGGAGLLGEQHSASLAEAGAKVVLVDVSLERVEAMALKQRNLLDADVCGFQVDITDARQVSLLRDRVLAKYGRIDILINNAANNPKMESKGDVNFSRFENFPLSQWHDDMAVGITGAFLCCQAIGTEMARQRKGVIVNVASDLAVIAPDQRIYKQDGVAPGQQPVKPVTYSVVKTALLGLTRYLATYWAEAGVRVNAISPGGVYNHQPEEFVQRLSTLIPLGRMANVDEYRGALLFLCSDASSYMTGTNLVVDGGRSCW